MVKTLFDKVWDSHVVDQLEHGPDILYIDKHLIHEVTSPQAFAVLEDKNIPVFRPKQIEDALSNEFSASALDGIKLPADDMLSDIHAKGDYRAHLIVEMAKRAVNTVQ